MVSRLKSKGAKECSFLPKDACTDARRSDRSRQEFSNECLAVKFRFGAAETEFSKFARRQLERLAKCTDEPRGPRRAAEADPAPPDGPVG